MCRLLAVKADAPFAATPHLERFARIARRSKEYQGHGWGCAWREANVWRLYHSIRPVWEQDAFDRFPPTDRLLVHARSAFRNEGICVENNMPFFDGENVFIFNGELRGVRIREQGRIGAEKVFNFIKRFDRGDMRAAIERGMGVIEKRCRYLRAANLIVARGRDLYVATRFNEDPDYFQMHLRAELNSIVIGSEPYPGESGWAPLPNGSVRAL